MNTYDPLKKHDWLDSMTLEHPVSWTCGDCGAVARSDWSKDYLDHTKCIRDEPTLGGHTFPTLRVAAGASGGRMFTTFEFEGQLFTISGVSGDPSDPSTYGVTSIGLGDETISHSRYTEWLNVLRRRGIAERRDAARDADDRASHHDNG